MISAVSNFIQLYTEGPSQESKARKRNKRHKYWKRSKGFICR